jgi:hypothetical protein
MCLKLKPLTLTLNADDGITPHDGSAVKNIICELGCRRHDARVELSTPTAL